MNHTNCLTVVLTTGILSCPFIPSSMSAASWKPVEGNIMTRWAHDVSPENALPEYPRPQLVRHDWQNLNGLWDYSITSTNAAMPATADGKILVPYPIESALSGVKRRVGADQRVWYRRTFKTPTSWKGRRVLLHLGAVDWEAVVTVNGKLMGTHRGGYDAFSFDVTDALNPKGEQEIRISVWDPHDEGPQPRGKQVKNPEGIWYTPTTGIWQTAWLEPVATAHIDALKITPDFDQSTVGIMATVVGNKGDVSYRVDVLSGRVVLQSSTLGVVSPSSSAAPRTMSGMRLHIPDAKPWSPNAPHLYDLRVSLIEKGKTVDSVMSYFGMRKISVARDAEGLLRMQLNNQTLFQCGPLDQGFWPDGLYTAPTDAALRYDIEMTQRLGFNLIRKHVKVEPERWYYWCDKLGVLVWQDMPSGDRNAEWHGPSGVDGREMTRSADSKAIYQRELKSLIDGRYNHPCIVTWVPFNEGWGQFDTVRTLEWVTQYDPSRLVDGASGGNHFPAGHILDHHQYPGPGAPVRVTDRAMVLGEFGGLGLPLPGHTWQEQKNWGYRNFKSQEEVTTAYLELIQKLQPMIQEKGLSAAIYTQTTDVEVEVNGLMTYDREVLKLDEKRVSEANRALHSKPSPGR